jgi:NhaA family Na+:H+ antiporter
VNTDFLREESTGGVVLLAAALVALVWANVAPVGYEDVWHADLVWLDARHWVNDGLMAIFFYVVALEIKRELVIGELREPRAAALPVIAAVGGVVVPIALFLALAGGGDAADGWAIPAATDIAFAVGVLALLGDRLPAGVRLLLLSIAIVDDVIAIAIIALFYASEIEPLWLVGAAAALLVFRRAGPAALVVAVVAWICFHESGVHATIAGVALGLLTPRERLAHLEHLLHPLTAFLVVPLFALANAGVELRTDALDSRLTWAVAGALVVGKLVGIAGATLVALRLRWGTLPEGVARVHVVGAAALGGIGFTVSLFIAQLAYDEPALINQAKIGILLASVAAALAGAAILFVSSRAPASGTAARRPRRPPSASPGG